jgi:hypothetical protein
MEGMMTEQELFEELERLAPDLVGRLLACKLALQRLGRCECTSEEALDAVARAVEGRVIGPALLKVLAKRDAARRSGPAGS